MLETICDNARHVLHGRRQVFRKKSKSAWDELLLLAINTTKCVILHAPGGGCVVRDMGCRNGS